MEQTQLVELVKVIKPEEKEHLIQFASLKNFNTGRMSQYIAPLLDICLNHPWNDAGQTLGKSKVYSYVFPNQPVVEGKLEKVMVEAQMVIRTFLLANFYLREENEFYQTLDYAEIVRQRGLESRHRLLIAKLEKSQEEAILKNTSFYHKQLYLETAIHQQEGAHNLNKGDINITNVFLANESYYQLRRIDLFNRYLLQQRITKLEPHALLAKQLDELSIPEMLLEESPYLKINYAIFNMLKKDSPDESDLQLLLNLLRIHENDLDLVTLQEFYVHLRNLIAIRSYVNPLEDKFINMLQDLYVDNLKRGFLHCQGKLTAGRYLAVANNALHLGLTDWANDFIEKYKDDILEENEKQGVYRFTKALYLFAIGEYSTCLDFIPATSPFVNFMLHAKRLELKVYYELRSDLLSYKLDAFKMFLSRTSPKLLSDLFRQLNIDFANMIIQLTASIPGDKKRADRLIQRITEKHQLYESRWLLAKAQALKQK